MKRMGGMKRRLNRLVDRRRLREADARELLNRANAAQLAGDSALARQLTDEMVQQLWDVAKARGDSDTANLCSRYMLLKGAP